MPKIICETYRHTYYTILELGSTFGRYWGNMDKGAYCFKVPFSCRLVIYTQMQTYKDYPATYKATYKLQYTNGREVCARNK
jgi:hypothetical protein